MLRKPDFEKVKIDVINMLADIELGKNLLGHKRYLQETIIDVEEYINECTFLDQDIEVYRDSKIWLIQLMDQINKRIAGNNESFLNTPTQ